MIDQYDQNKVVDFYLKTISRILGKRKSTKSDTRTEIKAS